MSGVIFIVLFFILLFLSQNIGCIIINICTKVHIFFGFLLSCFSLLSQIFGVHLKYLYTTSELLSRETMMMVSPPIAVEETFTNLPLLLALQLSGCVRKAKVDMFSWVFFQKFQFYERKYRKLVHLAFP